MTEDSFKYFPLEGECRCGSFETMYVGDVFVDEKCCHCGLIVCGGYLKDTEEVTEGAFEDFEPITMDEETNATEEHDTFHHDLGNERLDDKEFRLLLDLFMVSDPWPLEDDRFVIMEKLLMKEAHVRGFDSYIEGYHEFEP